MTTIFAGSRTLGQAEMDRAFQYYSLNITELVCGCADGIDRAALHIARLYDIPIRFFPAWPTQHLWAVQNKLPGEIIDIPHKKYRGPCKAWGVQRNLRMAQYADALLAVMDVSRSARGTRGTANMISTASELGLVVTTFRVDQGIIEKIEYNKAARGK